MRVHKSFKEPKVTELRCCHQCHHFYLVTPLNRRTIFCGKSCSSIATKTIIAAQVGLKALRAELAESRAKVCPYCQRRFTKPNGIAWSNWEKRVHCSISCASTVKNEKLRKAKELAKALGLDKAFSKP